MKLIRSIKCSLKFATQSKLNQLKTILSEYGKVVNFFINYFWGNTPNKLDLTKEIINLPKNTWLSYRLKTVATREAIDMIIATKERWKNEPEKMKIPVHKGNKIYASQLIAKLNLSKKSTEFDAWLHLSCIGKEIIFDLPIKFHKHFNYLNSIGKRLNSYIITDKYVQFCFEINTGKKKEGKNAIGIDTGIKSLASTSTGNQYGKDIEECIKRVKQCKQGSNGQKRARRALKQRIDEVAKEVIKKEHPDLIIVEKLKNLNNKTNAKCLLAKNMRCSIGTWNWKYWLKRIEFACQMNRVSFRTVSPFYTSQTCPSCGHVNRGNRVGEVFHCLSCGCTGNADLIASRNILNRFLMGLYGAHYKPKIVRF